MYHDLHWPALFWSHPQLGAEAAEMFFSQRKLVLYGFVALASLQRMLRLFNNAWTKYVKCVLFIPTLCYNSIWSNVETRVREMSEEGGLNGVTWVGSRENEGLDQHVRKRGEEVMILEAENIATGEQIAERVQGRFTCIIGSKVHWFHR